MNEKETSASLVAVQAQTALLSDRLLLFENEHITYDDLENVR